jgi:hypothetical protein
MAINLRFSSHLSAVCKIRLVARRRCRANAIWGTAAIVRDADGNQFVLGTP